MFDTTVSSSTPDVAAPDVAAPDVPAPGVRAPGVRAPGVRAPVPGDPDPDPAPVPLEPLVPLERLEAQICELAGHLAAATCRFLVLLADFDARRGWASWEMRSCATWLSWKCQLSSGAAREHVRVARALRDLPVIRGEFAAGRLSYAKVRALTRIATPATERGPGRDRRPDDRESAGAVRPRPPEGHQRRRRRGPDPAAAGLAARGGRVPGRRVPAAAAGRRGAAQGAPRRGRRPGTPSRPSGRGTFPRRRPRPGPPGPGSPRPAGGGDVFEPGRRAGGYRRGVPGRGGRRGR